MAFQGNEGGEKSRDSVHVLFLMRRQGIGDNIWPSHVVELY